MNVKLFPATVISSLENQNAVLDIQRDNYQSLVTAIEAYREERALAGRAFGAHKNYFGEGHLPFITAYRRIMLSQRNANVSHIGHLRALTHDYYNQQQIESELNQLFWSIAALRASIALAPLTSIFLRNLLNTRLERQRLLREKRDQLNTYVANTRTLYSGVESQLQNVRRLLLRLEMQTKCESTGVVSLPTVEYETLDALQAALAPLPPEDRMAILQIVMNAPEEYRAMFFAVADQINIGCMSSSGVFLRPGQRDGTIERATIEFNLAEDRNNPRGAYFTFFHEVGHLIDWALTENNELFTRGEPHRDTLFTALNNDVRNQLRTVANSLEMPEGMHPSEHHRIQAQAINNIMAGRASSCPFQQSLQEEMNGLCLRDNNDGILFGNDQRFTNANPGLKQTAHSMINPSNIFGGITNNAVRGRYSHTRDNYWFNDDGSPTYRQNSEFFANHFASATLNNGEALAAEKFYFPEASEMLTTTILPDMVSGGNVK